MLVTLPMTYYPFGMVIPVVGCLLSLFAAASLIRGKGLGWIDDTRVIGTYLLMVGGAFLLSSIIVASPSLIGKIGSYIVFYAMLGILGITVGLSLLIKKSWSWGLVVLAMGLYALIIELANSLQYDPPQIPDESHMARSNGGQRGRQRSARKPDAVYPAYFPKPVIEKPRILKPVLSKSGIYERPYFSKPSISKPVVEKPVFRKNDFFQGSSAPRKNRKNSRSGGD